MVTVEKITSPNQIRHWNDSIPLHYKYTHGVAGEKFLRHLQNEGKILGTRCRRCNVSYIPPRLYCRDCFDELNDWVGVTLPGTVHSVTVVHEPNGGDAVNRPLKVGVVKFKGFEGGLIHFVDARCRIGSKVRPVFKAKERRIGSILDIERFALV